jgi:hypothetical protein
LEITPAPTLPPTPHVILRQKEVKKGRTDKRKRIVKGKWKIIKGENIKIHARSRSNNVEIYTNIAKVEKLACPEGQCPLPEREASLHTADNTDPAFFAHQDVRLELLQRHQVLRLYAVDNLRQVRNFFFIS